jgi:hypothetical protein
MARDPSHEFSKAMCEALGLDPNAVRRLVIVLDAGYMPMVRASLVIRDGDALTKAVRRFQFTATPFIGKG